MDVLNRRQALKDLFKLTEDDIIRVIKRGQLKKLHNMQAFSVSITANIYVYNL